MSAKKYEENVTGEGFYETFYTKSFLRPSRAYKIPCGAKRDCFARPADGGFKLAMTITKKQFSPILFFLLKYNYQKEKTHRG